VEAKMAQIEDLFQQAVSKVKNLEEMRREENSLQEISFDDMTGKNYKSAKKINLFESGEKTIGSDRRISP